MTFTEYVANTGRDLFKPTFLSNQKNFIKVSSSAINASIMNSYTLFFDLQAALSAHFALHSAHFAPFSQLFCF